MKKLELVKAFEMEQENEYLQAYKQMFPEARPSIFQMELIEGTVDDLRAWRKTLIFWAGNDYRPQSIFKMLDYYKQVKEGTVQTFESRESREKTEQRMKSRVGHPDTFGKDFGT